MRCDADCRGCCSEAVPVSELELAQVLLYANEHGLEPQEADEQMCPWYQQGRCAVHEVRPAGCHAFGHHPALACERGYNANASELELEALRDAYRAAGPQVRFLHEVRRTGSVAVDESVWKMVQRNRARAGLPPLRGVEEDDHEHAKQAG